MKKHLKTPLAVAMGTASLVAGAVNAQTDPFALQELNGGYMQVAAAETAQPQEGATPDKSAEMSCGAMMKPKTTEMSCGANMGGMDKDQMKKPQEGKCGGQKSQEASCGAMMKKSDK